MWLYLIFGLIISIGLCALLFMFYEWYQALGVIALCIIGAIVANIFNLNFDWFSYVIGYLLCLISHITINKED